MNEIISTDEYVYKYKSNNEQSPEEIHNNTIILNQYQTFILNEYSFIIGTTDNNNLYIECKKNDKYYRKITSKKKVSIMNNKFKSCKNINEIYQLIIFSINKRQIDLVTIKNDKIKLILSITANNDSFPSSFELILKEEKNKSNLILNKINMKKGNESNSENLKESSSLFMEEELQYMKKQILGNNNIKKKDNSEDKINNIENTIINDDNFEEENEEAEDIDDYESNENETNKIIGMFNNLKKEINNIKNVINKTEEYNNEEKIKELEEKNEKLIEEIRKIKNDIKIITEENKKI